MRLLWVFLNEIITELKLDHITAVHGRAEDFAHKEDFRENFDICVSRAVANLSSLSELCITVVKKDGYFISYKSGAANDEVKASQKAIDTMGGALESIKKFDLGDNELTRSFIMIKKEVNTPNQYPRKAGKPIKNPL